jgi:hypothetical protein
MTIQDSPVGVVPDQAAAPAAAPGLRFDATVSRHLVHRASVAEVFVTDSAAVGADTFDVAAQLPRGHSIGEHAPLYDFMLLLEVVRQAGVLVSHRHLEVAPGTQFIFRSLRLHLDDLAAVRIGSSPAKAVVRVSVEPERSRSGRMKGLRFLGGVQIDGQSALQGEGTLLFLTDADYQALRAGMREAKLSTSRPVTARLAAAAPAAVGRRDPRNVVITPPLPQGDGRFGASLVVDVSHPHLFDHPLDHVPGNLELEACRQISLAAVAQRYGLAADGLTVVGVTADFTDFAELDLITRVTGDVGDLYYDDRLGTSVAPVTVELTQAGGVVATGKIEVAGWS